MTAISVERLLALLLGLRYRQVVTYRRTCITVTGFWILSIVGASTLSWNRLITSWFQYKVAALCLVTTTVAYTKIFCTLRHNQIHVQNHVAQGQPSQAIPLNIARYRKAVYSALWVQGTLVICYLPYVIVVALQPQRGMSLSIYRVESELIFLSALNIFFSVTAFLGNTLILVALHKETSLHAPSKLLYRNLAITDL
ncbi:unnamed protein product [Porites evermanni]|uniref:G-protein coupled receptors family 1 profile domain-containing protein n=1 Tax=Porites evermanni TaxID=104178 RepID=A0ABN8R717_9CNID|nr:unnamed protein product [Porites evermanni]